MTKRLGFSLAAAALLAACSGGGTDTSNPAVDKTFSYGSPVTATATQASAVSGALTGAIDLRSGASSSSVQGFADFGGLTTTLLGDSGVGFARPEPVLRSALQRVVPAASLATAPSGFDNPSCLTETPTKVTFALCKMTYSETSGSYVITVDGTFEVTNQEKLDWALVATMDLTASGATAHVEYADAGTLTVTASTIAGKMGRKVSANASGNGQTASFGVAEGVVIDATYQTSPTRCITGGTVEAKRVWTSKPQGATATAYADKAAKVTITGCGTATIATST